MEPSVEYSSLCAAYSFPTSRPGLLIRPGLLTMEVRKLIVIIIISISIIIISISVIIIVIIIIIKI